MPCHMEALGAAALRIMSAIRNEAFLGDRVARKRIAAYLLQLATLVGRIADIFPTFLPECDPSTFYHKSRPWFHGGPRRFVVSDADRTRDELLDFGGPSAGQATLIHVRRSALSSTDPAVARRVSRRRPRFGERRL